MSYFIDKTSQNITLSSMYKAKQLTEDGAKEVKPEWQDNLLVVKTYSTFDAVIYCHNEEEFNQQSKFDGTIKTWLVHPFAKQLADYKD